MKTDLEASTFQNLPAYRYIRVSDHIPKEQGTVALVKLFNPTGAGTWYIAEYDPETRIAYGVAEIHEAELGSFSMAELVEYRGRLDLPLERDLHWKPCPLSELSGGRRQEDAPPSQGDLEPWLSLWEAGMIHLPYPWCRGNPHVVDCLQAGYCRRDPSCGDN